MPVISGRLRPALGLRDATAIGLGAIIGGGIFVVTGIVAGLAGAGLIVSILIAASISFLTARSYAVLTVWRPAEGSVYTYARLLLAPFAGFAAGWMWIVSNIFSGAAVALGFAHYLAIVLPIGDPRWTAVALIAGFTALNFRGIEHSAGVNTILVLIKVVILIVFIAAGFVFVRPEHFVPFFRSAKGVWSGAFFIFFAFSGFARIAVLGEEVRTPEKTVPRAIFLALGLSTLLYVGVGAVAVGLVGGGELARSASPLATAAKAVPLPGLAGAITLGGLVATASVLLTSILGVSRMAFAMAREGDLPRRFGVLHTRFRTPSFSVLAAGCTVAATAAFVPLDHAVAVSTLATLLNYALANAAAVKIPGRNARRMKIVPILGGLACLGLLAFVSVGELAVGAGFLLTGVAIFLMNRRRRSSCDSNDLTG